MVIQLAKHRGIKTISTVRRAEQKEELLAIGHAVFIIVLFIIYFFFFLRPNIERHFYCWFFFDTLQP